MSVRSVYIPDPSIENDRLRISGEEHRHLSVARAEPGEALEIFNGKGGVWTAVMDTAGKRETVVRIDGFRQIERENVELILALSAIRIAAFEFAIDPGSSDMVTRSVNFSIAFTTERKLPIP